MKTIENLTRNMTRMLSLFIVFIFLFNYAAKAQKTMKSVEFNPISYMITAENDNILTIIFTSSLKNEILEKNMEFENWMMDLKEWAEDYDTSSAEAPTIEESFEKDLEYENWMFEKDLTKDEDSINQEAQKMESWMYSPTEWTFASR